jgi:hypothetical protein
MENYRKEWDMRKNKLSLLQNFDSTLHHRISAGASAA